VAGLAAVAAERSSGSLKAHSLRELYCVNMDCNMADENNQDEKPKLPFGIPHPPPEGSPPEEVQKWVESLDETGKAKLKEWLESLSDDELGQMLP